MNTLRLENINLHAPYRVLQDPERRNNFYFVSDSGARFDIDFTVNESIIPSGAYEFGITNRRHERSPLDPKLRLTIFAIIEEFFEVNGHDTMLYLADTGDRKQAFRNRLFVRWFNIYERRHLFIIRTAEGKMDGMMNFIAIISRKDNPNLPKVIEEFDSQDNYLFQKLGVAESEYLLFPDNQVSRQRYFLCFATFSSNIVVFGKMLVELIYECRTYTSTLFIN